MEVLILLSDLSMKNNPESFSRLFVNINPRNRQKNVSQILAEISVNGGDKFLIFTVLKRTWQDYSGSMFFRIL